MNKLYVIAGHNVAAPGAVAYNGRYEHYYTSELQRLVYKTPIAEETTFALDAEDDTLTKTVQWVNETFEPGDMLVDIHFNHNHPSATGTEVFVHPRTSGENKDIADSMVQKISEVVGIPVRRTVPDRDHKYPEDSAVGSLAIIENTNLPAILLEVCFMNPQDLEKYEQVKQQVAEVILESYGLKKKPV